MIPDDLYHFMLSTYLQKYHIQKQHWHKCQHGCRGQPLIIQVLKIVKEKVRNGVDLIWRIGTIEQVILPKQPEETDYIKDQKEPLIGP